MLSENLKDIFLRASNIIQECIKVDRTIFLNASIGTFRGHMGKVHNSFIKGQSQESLISSSEGEC